MARAKSKPFDVRQWAADVKPAGNGRCQTCAHEEAAEAVKVIAEMRLRGETHATFPGIARMLKERYGYAYGPAALLGHVRKCLGISWRNAKRIE